jgi:proteasome beta subunit
MPLFDPTADPGSNFPELLRRTGLAATPVSGGSIDVPHATTCVAIRFADGVVMAGDRRATSGNLISHRTMEKVVQADRHSAVAIAGAAGTALEMIRLFQLQLEHYEKVEGTSLSLEGKANQLSMMVRGNLQQAMMGMVVVPIFGGYDLRRESGRLWDFDATGGPDALRGIYPVVATIEADGWTRLDDDDLAGRFEAIVDEVRAR